MMKALTLPEVTEKTGIRRSTLYKLVHLGEFPAPAKIGRRTIFSSDEVEAWLQARFDAREGGVK